MLQAVGKLWASLKGWTTGFTSSISLCREPPARTPASGSQPQYPAALPAVWKLHQALQPKKSASLVPARGQPLRNGPRRHLGPRRPRAQLLRVGCALGTCQVQNLSHRLWQERVTERFFCCRSVALTYGWQPSTSATSTLIQQTSLISRVMMHH